ncbi:DNA polymerase III subunit chi [Thiohalophilus thiocyanatoxydans]|uniref:DNA polymerase III chi subunit n=1 Tax=Thiohalophilus thiocyanatoxydans TaxID=381308 RepID=A0A4R8ILG5_9GAMM|nr:DNA polymerase III subunit chi [Thiohalophilus thiocyanatoxydans]TDY01641.1 DNA polymerase III chi subunit [Thiohalophilus thiocyanatoxydans]
MTRVDFYIVEDNRAQARQRLACRLAEKAYTLNHTVYIHADDRQQAEQLDQLLWTFRDGSFIPHSLQDDKVASQAAIVIGCDDEPKEHNQVLINLGETVPPFFSRFERVAELITGDEQARQAGRERFRFYRDRGYELNTHNLDDKAS